MASPVLVILFAGTVLSSLHQTTRYMVQGRTDPVPGELQEQLDVFQAGMVGMQKTLTTIQTATAGLVAKMETMQDGLISVQETQAATSDLLKLLSGEVQIVRTTLEHLPGRQLGHLCRSDSDCGNIANTVCAGQVCACAEGHWSHENQTCRPYVSGGQICEYDEDCAGAGSHLACVHGVCGCGVRRHGRYEYRLVGGDACFEGRLELSRDGEAWGQVCDDGWEADDAQVVCRSMGFRGGVAHCCSQPYGKGGAVKFHMDDAACSGSEVHLMQCSFNGTNLGVWDQHNCEDSEVAAVTCQP